MIIGRSAQKLYAAPQKAPEEMLAAQVDISQEEPQGVAEPEALSELEEQRRLNAYLKGETVRRKMEATQQAKRPWWKW